MKALTRYADELGSEIDNNIIDKVFAILTLTKSALERCIASSAHQKIRGQDTAIIEDGIFA